MVKNIQEEILRLKEATGVALMAHVYVGHEITEIADVVGDSFYLSQMAQRCTQQNILLCGVQFMAETAKLLSPEKQVYLAHPGATCPMAIQFTPADVLREKAKYPGCKVVAYVNTTAALKAVSDVCVTSSTAEKIVRRLDAEDILFLPDCNLGSYVQKLVPEKRIHLMQGGCPVHAAMTTEDVALARAAHPGAPLLVHPECPQPVTDAADFAGATSEIMRYAEQADGTDFIIGTELSVIEHLQYSCPDKRFHPLSKRLLCPDMKLTTLMDVLHMLQAIADGTAVSLTLPPEELQKAQHSIQEMLRLGAD